MIMEPILQHFDLERPAVTIKTHTSDYTRGVIYSQHDEKGIVHTVEYDSRKVNNLEDNYNIHDNQLLAIVDTLQKWDTYCKITGLKIMFLMDHKNFEYWKTK